MSTIKTGIASYGMSGKVFHGPLLKVNPNFSVTDIYERSKNNSASDFPQANIVRSYDAIINNPEIELIIVNTPDHTHYEYAKLALLANKHVVVEKPFTQKTEEADELISIAKKNNLVLSVFHNRRWDGDFLTVKKILSENALGRLVEYEAHFDRFRNFVRKGSWKEQATFNTGTVYNLGSHMIDQALQLFGIPEKIYADIKIMRDGGEVDDFFDIDLIYSSDIKVRIKGTYLAKEPIPRYTLHGTKGSFLKWGLDPQEDALNAGSLPGDENWGEDEEEFYGILNTTIDDKEVYGRIPTEKGAYETYYENIYDAIRKNKPLVVTSQEARDTIQIIELAYRSSSNKQVIDVKKG